jgi:hypothetical protein
MARRIVRRLRNANATEAARACPIPDGRLLVSWRLRRLVAAGALATHAPGAYYLVESGWCAWRARRRRRALTIVGIVILATLLVLSLFGR